MTGLHRSSLLGLFAGAALALAFPNALDGRGACNHDNCLRAVIASNAKPYASSASQGCVSFFRQTVTPCPSAASTVTATATTTETVETPTTTTVVVTLAVTASTETQVSSVPYTTTDATQEATITMATVNFQATVTSTATATVTVTSAAVTTSTTSVYNFAPSPAPVAPARRGAQALDARAPGGGQCPVIKVPSAVPTYASACSGAVRYSSACSCIGITQQTVTATLPVVTETATSTAFVTPVAATATSTVFASVTATVTETSSQEVDATATQTVSVTATSVLDPVTVTATSTATRTVTTISTSFVPGPTRYCQMYLRASGGVVDGQYIFAVAGQLTTVIEPAGSAKKTLFQLDSAGKVHPVDGTMAGLTLYQYGSASPYANLMTDANIARYGYFPIYCRVNSATLEVLCLSRTPTTQPVFSDGYQTPDGPYLWLGTYVQSGSTPFKMYADPVACTT